MMESPQPGESLVERMEDVPQRLGARGAIREARYKSEGTVRWLRRGANFICGIFVVWGLCVVFFIVKSGLMTSLVATVCILILGWFLYAIMVVCIEGLVVMEGGVRMVGSEIKARRYRHQRAQRLKKSELAGSLMLDEGQGSQSGDLSLADGVGGLRIVDEKGGDFKGQDG